TWISTLSLHDALPIWGADVAGQHLQLPGEPVPRRDGVAHALAGRDLFHLLWIAHQRDALDVGLRLVGGGFELGERPGALRGALRSEEHTSELQSRENL